MDLNDLFFHQQLSLLRAMDATCPEIRARHEGLARSYSEQIAACRAQMRQRDPGETDGISIKQLNFQNLLK